MELLGDLSIIEDGKYIALWCGYTIKLAFSNGNLSKDIPTKEGIRGMSTEIVEIKDGVGYIIESTPKDIEELTKEYRVEPDFFNRIFDNLRK